MRSLLGPIWLVVFLVGCKGVVNDTVETLPLEGLETSSTQCRDKKDNDFDGRVDCEDEDCKGNAFCADVTVEDGGESNTDGEGDSASETATDTESGGDTGEAPVACDNGADCEDGDFCDLTLDTPVCLPPPSGQGATCTSDDDCAGYDADYCESFVSGACLKSDCSPELDNCSPGYHCCDFQFMGLPALCVDETLSGGICRTGVECTGNADCVEGNYCDLTLDPPSCVMPPSGQGRPCTTPEDCASFTADYCESMVSGTCLAQGCDKEANNCSSGYKCCDFQWIGLPSLCVDEALSGDGCACAEDGNCRADEFCDVTLEVPVCTPL